jgi:hypothetical protein
MLVARDSVSYSELATDEYMIRIYSFTEHDIRALTDARGTYDGKGPILFIAQLMTPTVQ